MALKQLDNKNISKHLGQTSKYKSTYDPALLVREPRSSNRIHLDIEEGNLPFRGGDTWNAYEVSGLTDNGLPVVGIGKIYYPCDSEYIVESKSIKLYFNSFNMTRLGEDDEEVLSNIQIKAQRDLTKLLGKNVEVRIASNREVLNNKITAAEDWGHDKAEGNDYITLEDDYPVEDLDFTVYQETPKLLEVIDSPVDKIQYHSALLKSNCRVTSQPDWGDVYIEMEGDKTVDPISLLKYIVSFRDECHFHEEICETIYKRLYDLVEPDKLAVRCLYARRGGIDINPERYSEESLRNWVLHDVTVPHVKTPKQ